MRRELRLATAVAVLTTFISGGFGATASVARADEKADRDSRALDLFEKSEAAYESGRFADAIALLRQSYELKKEAVLLYNMGRAYEGLGELANAARAYEGFLTAQPNAQDRGALERRIVTLRRQLAEQEALRKKAAAAPPPRSPSAVPWVIAGVGAAGLVTGGVMGILASQRNHDARTEPTYARADDLHTQAESFSKISNICFIAGGVVLAVGVVWGIFDVSASKSSRRAGLLTGGPTFSF